MSKASTRIFKIVSHARQVCKLLTVKPLPPKAIERLLFRAVSQQERASTMITQGFLLRFTKVYS